MKCPFRSTARLQDLLIMKAQYMDYCSCVLELCIVLPTQIDPRTPFLHDGCR